MGCKGRGLFLCTTLSIVSSEFCRNRATTPFACPGTRGNARKDALSYVNGMMFTTYDRDNDPWTSSRYNNNCAVKQYAGFWYNKCSHCKPNGFRRRGEFFWFEMALQSCRMWLLCR